MTGTSMARRSLVPLAAEVLAELLRRIEPERVTISAYGLREGLLYRQMPEPMRALDPLIEACRHMEAASARAPGFGAALHAWLASFYADRGPADQRLILAACLLHDVNWRAHPDYRAELCFELVTRSNIAGIDHADRVFLGLALLNRYKAVAPAEEVERYRGLLSPERAADAAVLGRAMRLGSMLSGSATGVLEHRHPGARRRARRPDAARPGARVRRRGGGAAAAGAGRAAELDRRAGAWSGERAPTPVK